MKRIILATFKGEDGSLGYIKGEFYPLMVEHSIPGWRRFLKNWPQEWEVIITIPTFCPYSSWGAFRQNWEIEDGLGKELLK